MGFGYHIFLLFALFLNFVCVCVGGVLYACHDAMVVRGQLERVVPSLCLL